MAAFDLVIKNGTIVDGTQVPRYVADIGIKDGVIAQIGGGLSTSGSDVIDAAGKIVAPGVIDIHTHYDAQLHWDPYATNSGWHGTTTIGVGNCGFGFAPCKTDMQERYMRMMENTEQVPLGAMRKALGWEWETFPQWIEHLKGVSKGVNVVSFVPLNPLLIYVMGVDAAKSRAATKTEQKRMKDILNRAMDAGAVGFGFSYQGRHNTHVDCDGTPMPTDTMARDDIYALAEVLRDRNQGSIQALVDTPGARFGEVGLEVARISRRPVIHNITLVNDYLPTYHLEMLEMLEKAEAEGLSIYSQTLTLRGWNEFKAGDWNIWDISEIWREFSVCGDTAAKFAKAQDPDYRRRLREKYDPIELAPVGGPLETYVLNQAHGVKKWVAYEGKSIAAIAAALNRQDVTDVFLDIVVDTKMEADFLLPDAVSTDTASVAKVLKHRRTIPGTSDGGAHIKFWAGGQYSTDLLMWMVRETAHLTLEEMHFKLSYLSARVLELNKRGALMEGFAADVMIYDYERLNYRHGKYEIAHDLPDGDWRRICRPQGIEAVIVNGIPTFKSNVCTGAVPGRLVGGGGASMDEWLMHPSVAAE